MKTEAEMNIHLGSCAVGRAQDVQIEEKSTHDESESPLFYNGLSSMSQKTSAQLLEIQRIFCQSALCSCFIDSDICPYCGRNLFKFYTEEDLNTKIITSCPYCQRSFVK